MLRPAATGITTLRIGKPSTSSVGNWNGSRSTSSSWPPRLTRCTISFRRILRRTAVSPKMALMSSRPRPRTSSRFCSRAGQRPSIILGAMRENSTASSATRPCEREISSRPNSLLPRPESPVISTPTPSTSMNTPCMMMRCASFFDRYTRRKSITCAAGSGVENSGIFFSSQMARMSGGVSSPCATISAGGLPPISSPIRWARVSDFRRW